MNCNLPKEKREKMNKGETSNVSSGFFSYKNGFSASLNHALNLNNYLFHAVGSYTGRENIVKRIND